MAYKHVIRAKTKNLFNKNNATIINGYIYSGQLIITKSPVDRTIVFPCKPNTTYTFSKMYTNRLFMAETSEETPAVGTTCTNPIESLGEPPSQNYCTLTTTATAKNLIITVCALYNTETYTLQEILDSVQFEEGSTPTPYTPYNYLSSNKRMIKVSDVCQLLDKSKFRGTQTIEGVTFTNNGDGTYSVSGTCSDNPPNGVYIEYVVQVWNNDFTSKYFVPGHKYLAGGGFQLVNDKIAVVQWILSYTGGYYATNSNQSGTTLGEYPTNNLNRILIRVYAGMTVDFTFKPQFFDLTEMFGSGYEPATVAEFRQRFPNELYPYSPQCWLTSYKSAVVCKTKNLFDFANI